MKYLILLLVLMGLAWWAFGRRDKQDRPPPSKKNTDPGGGPQQMLACAHCGLHLPRDEAVADVAGRMFCNEAHRLAGPR